MKPYCILLKKQLAASILALFFLFSVAYSQENNSIKPDSVSGYKNVNGMKMYYEIHGKGRPLVLLHGGGSTIRTTFGRVLPLFALHRQVIAVELQAHGHTADRIKPLTFEQDADDVNELLQQLNIPAADIFGFSNGGTTATYLAIRHPERVNKLILASIFYEREGAIPGLFSFIEKGKFSDMPQPLIDAYKQINKDEAALMNMHDKDKYRILHFQNIPDSALRGINSPVLLLSGDKDVALPEHVVKMSRVLPHASIAMLPGGHGQYIGEVVFEKKGSKVPELVVAMIEEFLDEK